MSPAELAAKFHRLRELAPAFGVRTLRQSIERAANEAMASDNPKTRDETAPTVVGLPARFGPPQLRGPVRVIRH